MSSVPNRHACQYPLWQRAPTVLGSQQLQQFRMSPSTPLHGLLPPLAAMNVHPHHSLTWANLHQRPEAWLEQSRWIQVPPAASAAVASSKLESWRPGWELGTTVQFISWPVIALINMLSQALFISFSTVKFTAQCQCVSAGMTKS